MTLIDEWVPATVTCINCFKEWDEREVFVTMGIVYCPVCVVYVLRNRITSEQRDDIVNELKTYSMLRPTKIIAGHEDCRECLMDRIGE